MLHVVDDKTAPDKVQQQRRLGLPFTVVTGTLDVGRVLVEAMREGLPLDNVAVLSWNNGTSLRHATRITVAKAQGYPPDLPLDDMIAGADPEVIGSVWQVIDAHSWDRRPPMTGDHRRAVTDEYVELIRRVSEESDPTFLRGVRRQIETAIRLSIKSRLDELTLHEACRRAGAAGKRLPAWSFICEAVDYFGEYKRQESVADLADHLAAKLEPVPACTLALIDDAGAIPLLGLRALRRLLPHASFVLAGMDGEDATRRAKSIF